MIPNWINLPPLAGLYGPGVAAFALALGGVALFRRAEVRWAPVAALAVAGGWMLLLPAPRAWVFPRVAAEHLVMPALAAAAGAALVPWVSGLSRVRWWLGTGVLGFAGWWLAGAGVARGEFWRVWFAVTLVAWGLRLSGGRVASGGVTTGLVLLAGTVAAGVSALWSGVAWVLLGGLLGVAVIRPAAVLGVVVPAVAVVGTDLGTGGLVRGRLEMMDLVCAGSVVAPGVNRWLGGRVERWMGRWAGRQFGAVAGAVGTAAVIVGVAWVAAKLLRR